MKIVLIIVGVLAALAIVGGVLLVSLAPEDMLKSFRSGPAGTEVRTEVAEESTLIETVSAPGKIEPLTKVEISSEISSRIEQLPFREGERVQRGDVIVMLDDRDLRAALQASEAQRESEQFRLQSEQARLTGLLQHRDYALKTLERQKALYDTGDVSRSALDDAMEADADLEANVEASKHAISVIESLLAAAKADMDRAADALTKTVIRSPMNGIITSLNAEVGEVVLVGTMNNPGTVIMTVADLSRMIHNAEIAESDIAAVAEDQRARIHVNAYPDEIFQGIVRKIALQRTDNPDGTGYFETEVELDLQGRRIYSGLIANVDVEIAEHRGIVVPSQAIVERLVDDLPHEFRNSPLVDRNKRVTNVVYRVVDGKAVCTPVRPGPSDLTHTLVEDGLDPGSVVVTGPYKVLEKIKHNEPVKPEGVDAGDTVPDEAGVAEGPDQESPPAAGNVE